jgi:hypothetical protein
VTMSASFMLAMAAIVVFADSGALLGPLLVGAFGGIYWPHIVEHDWRKIIENSAIFALSAFVAALVFDALGPDLQQTLPLLVAGVLAAAAFDAVDCGLLIVALLVWTGERPITPRVVAMTLIHMCPFVVIGVFMGQLYLDVGPLIVPLFVVPILIARQAFASYLALKRSHDDTVRILIGALEAKDQYTAGHAERVAMFANYIGLELGLSAKRLERLRLAALMHDVGKLVVPNHLLNKPGKLTEAEFARVRLHESVSLEILTRIDFLAPVAPSALSEFTRFTPVADERGQPIEPHIVAVADAFDAMTSTRSYRKALAQSTAFKELRENAGKQFHPRVVDVLIVAIERRGEVYGEGHEADVHEFAVEPPTVGLGSAGLGDLLEESDSDSPGVTAT